MKGVFGFFPRLQILLSFSLPTSWHAKKIGNHLNKSQQFGQDQKIGMVHFGHNPKTPKTLQ
jgi:hypothetical protein